MYKFWRVMIVIWSSNYVVFKIPRFKNLRLPNSMASKFHAFNVPCLQKKKLAPRRPGSARARLPPVPEVPETVKRSGRATCVSPYRLPTVVLLPSYHLPTLFLRSSCHLLAILLPSPYHLPPVLGDFPCRPAAVCLAPAYRHPTVALPTRYPASVALAISY